MGLFETITGKNKPKTVDVQSAGSGDASGRLVTEIDTAQTNAEGTRETIETTWNDEYKIYIGKQWETSFASRSSSGRKRNYNSQDNFIFPTIQNQTSALTASMPEPRFEGMEVNDDEAANQLDDLVPDILTKNNFRNDWKKIVLQGVMHGPFIGAVTWDQDWIGGSGPNRWVGEVRTQFVKKEEFYPDPAILDLESRLQDCSYINIKQRKKLSYFRERWPETGKEVLTDNTSEEDEGPEPEQAWLIMHWHRGVPKMVSAEDKARFEQLAAEADADGLPYKAQEYRDMASGSLKGIHVAYKAGTVLLDYVSYVHDDGLYPFVYKVMYADEKQPWGMGEVRNLIIPQILHNKADEIELGGMAAEGLGGAYYRKGALSEQQRRAIVDNGSKAGMLFEVNEPDQIKDRTGARVPASISVYKEHKQKVIDTVSQNTAIQQGVSPGANVPFSTIQELGARADTRTKGKVEVLEDFLTEFVRLIVNRVAQFYTEDRVYRITGDRQRANEQAQIMKALQQIANAPQGTDPTQQLGMMIQVLQQVKMGQQQRTRTFSRKSLVRSWTRDVTVDEMGNQVEMREEFIPEFDIKVKVMDEKPTDRNYYTNAAMSLLGKAMGIKAFWKTIEDGKFPPIDDILQELEEQKQAQEQAAMQAQAMKSSGTPTG